MFIDITAIFVSFICAVDVNEFFFSFFIRFQHLHNEKYMQCCITLAPEEGYKILNKKTKIVKILSFSLARHTYYM